MKNSLYLSIFWIIMLTSCSSETCKIDFNENPNNFEKTVSDIIALDLKVNSDKPSPRILKTIKKKDNIVDDVVFASVEFIECYADSTIIFQAPNCSKGNMLKDDISILVYAPKGESYITKKRNVRGLRRINKNWFQGYHVISMAN